MQYNANKNDGECLQTNIGMKVYVLKGLLSGSPT